MPILYNSVGSPVIEFIEFVKGSWEIYPGKESLCQFRRCKRRGFDPWVGKISWSRKWQPTVVFLPVKFHGQRNLVGYSPRGCKESDMTDIAQT